MKHRADAEDALALAMAFLIVVFLVLTIQHVWGW